MRYLTKNHKEHKEAFPIPGKDEPAGKKPGKLYVLVSLFAGLSAVSLLMPTWSASSTNANPAISVPDQLGAWKLIATPPLTYSFLGSVRYSSTLYRDYSKNNEAVSLFIGTDDRLRRQRSFLSGKNAYQEGVGLQMEQYTVDLGSGIGQAVAVVTDNGTQRLLSYHWYEGVESVAKEVLYSWLALDQSPFRREQPGRVTRVSTFVDLTPEGHTLADNRLRAFLRELKKHETTTTPLN